MPATYQTNGAICDATASQDTGALSTGIGCGANSSSPVAEQSLTASAFVAQRIGNGSGTVYALGSTYGASKGTRYVVATGAVADGAAVEVGWVNRSGRALVAGDYLWAVAA